MTDNVMAADAASAAPSPSVKEPIRIDLAGMQKAAEMKAAAADPEFLRKSRLAFSESFGAAAWLLSHDPVYRGVPLQGLEAAVGAPLRLGQYRIFRKEGMPFAYASWAFLSDEIAGRVAGGGRALSPEEWKTGDALWLVDLIAPFGGVELVQEEVRSKVFKDRPFRHLAAERQTGFADTEQQAAASNAVFAELDAAEPDGDIRIVRADEALRKRFGGVAVPFIKLFVMAGAFKGLGLDAAKIRRVAGHLIERPDAVVLVALHKGIPCGGFAGELHEFGFGRDRFAQEVAFLLHPRFRGKGVGQRLLAEFEAWARERGAVWLQYVQASGLEEVAAEKAYLKSGAQRTGYVYRKQLQARP